ncbi:MAG: hypothetical protein WEA04_00960, partial [Candidatus Andersenbacteria bacterium]
PGGAGTPQTKVPRYHGLMPVVTFIYTHRHGTSSYILASAAKLKTLIDFLLPGLQKRSLSGKKDVLFTKQDKEKIYGARL